MSIDWQIEFFDELPSTMNLAQSRGEAGAREGTVIVAKIQTAGIGRQGNKWEDRGGNLAASIILRSIITKSAGQYSYLAAVALADVVIERLISGLVYKHKWPNDGLINDMKFAGILPHLGDGFLNLGIGINIANAPDNRACLNKSFKKSIEVSEFLNLYLESLARNIADYRSNGFDNIRTKWLENAKGLGGPITARLPNETLNGIFEGLDEEGGLILKLDKGLVKVIRSGEVYFGTVT